MESLTRDEAIEILNGAMVAHLGLVVDGEPYVTPMSFVVDGDQILFRTQPGKKLQAMREHPRICVEVSEFDEESGDWVSVIVNGSAVETKDRGVGELTVQKLFAKYSAALGSPMTSGGLQPMAGLPHVVVVEIEEISGVSSGRGFTMRTRPGRL
jgi:nitroimidazol reductase NimA-like FMN-containing flavoprotein (pyridoxamine 5'-phosphate oxidase superfamily)